MKSYSIGKIWGIDIRLHSLFLLLIVLEGVISFSLHGLGYSLFATTMLLGVFSFVLLHELGHCAAALHFGVPVKDVTLLPIGGVASMAYIPREPKKEIIITLAGPAVNLALAILLSPIALATYFGLNTMIFVYFVAVNLVLLFFNLIPAFPMDGGRIYRAVRSKYIGRLAATREAVKISSFLALGLAIWGIIVLNVWLFFIAGFVWLAGKAELNQIEQENSLQGWNNFTNFSWNRNQQTQNYTQPEQQDPFIAKSPDYKFMQGRIYIYKQ